MCPGGHRGGGAYVEGPGEELASILTNKRVAQDVLRRGAQALLPRPQASALMNSLSQGLGDCSQQHSKRGVAQVGRICFLWNVCAALGVPESRGFPPCTSQAR